MQLSEDRIAVIRKAIETATDTQLDRLRMLVKYSDVSDEVKTAFNDALDSKENEPMTLQDAIASPGMEQYISSKVKEASDALQGTIDTMDTELKAAKKTADTALKDAIVLAATALRDGIDPLEFETSQKAFRDGLEAKTPEELATIFTDLNAKVNTLGQKPIETVQTDVGAGENGTEGKDGKDKGEDTEAPAPVKTAGDFFKRYTDNFVEGA